MIVRENLIEIEELEESYSLKFEERKDIYKDAVYFDLEHYVYKKPICIGVFGCCYYDEAQEALVVTQYMIENRNEIVEILHLAERYFKEIEMKNKKYIVTFSGNNDFHVINYLFEKYNIDFTITEHFKPLDLQKEYEKQFKESTGLKALEKKFGIIREGELISGSNLAKTFSKVIKDKDYIIRMPAEKITKILLYNEQDVVNLFHILLNWERTI
ncbi:RNase_H superfamily protein [Clostridium amylolyticum]|uniref:RNase_H superfamily protein n=1 Tax=Clostridium amylolyticum TaxID=1121298 RepID=A0A1M6KU24_9CLOT|nr:ribonuclease H-like domain-containing protein [Clostridium amylolyticum]SHJ62350.1 RNase_H superfamily protein [Clostridium amylolyticum]